MVKVYSDCAKRFDSLVIVAMAVTNKMFIDYALEKPRDVRDSTHGEIRAAMLAMRLVNKNYTTPQVVTLTSDSTTVVDSLSQFLQDKKVPYNTSYREDWVELLKLCKRHRVTTQHVKAHQLGPSYNTLCDKSARAML